jgi:hypothetical protein
VKKTSKNYILTVSLSSSSASSALQFWVGLGLGLLKQMSWASASQFLQPIFLASSSTPSIHLDFGRQLLPYTRVILKEEERENLEDLDYTVLMINYKEIRRENVDWAWLAQDKGQDHVIVT